MQREEERADANSSGSCRNLMKPHTRFGGGPPALRAPGLSHTIPKLTAGVVVRLKSLGYHDR